MSFKASYIKWVAIAILGLVGILGGLLYGAVSDTEQKRRVGIIDDRYLKEKVTIRDV